MRPAIGQFTLPGDNAGFCAAILQRGGISQPARLEALTYMRPGPQQQAGQPPQQPLVVNLLMQLRAYHDQSNTFLRSQAALNLQLTQQLRQVLTVSNGAVRARAGEIERAVRENLYRDGEFRRAMDSLTRELKKNGIESPELTVRLPGPGAAAGWTPGRMAQAQPAAGERSGPQAEPVLRALVPHAPREGEPLPARPSRRPQERDGRIGAERDPGEARTSKGAARRSRPAAGDTEREQSAARAQKGREPALPTGRETTSRSAAVRPHKGRSAGEKEAAQVQTAGERGTQPPLPGRDTDLTGGHAAPPPETERSERLATDRKFEAAPGLPAEQPGRIVRPDRILAGDRREPVGWRQPDGGEAQTRSDSPAEQPEQIVRPDRILTGDRREPVVWRQPDGEEAQARPDSPAERSERTVRPDRILAGSRSGRELPSSMEGRHTVLVWRRGEAAVEPGAAEAAGGGLTASATAGRQDRPERNAAPRLSLAVGRLWNPQSGVPSGLRRVQPGLAVREGRSPADTGTEGVQPPRAGERTLLRTLWRAEALTAPAAPFGPAFSTETDGLPRRSGDRPGQQKIGAAAWTAARSRGWTAPAFRRPEQLRFSGGAAGRTDSGDGSEGGIFRSPDAREPGARPPVWPERGKEPLPLAARPDGRGPAPGGPPQRTAAPPARGWPAPGEEPAGPARSGEVPGEAAPAAALIQRSAGRGEEEPAPEADRIPPARGRLLPAAAGKQGPVLYRARAMGAAGLIRPPARPWRAAERAIRPSGGPAVSGGEQAAERLAVPAGAAAWQRALRPPEGGERTAGLPVEPPSRTAEGAPGYRTAAPVWRDRPPVQASVPAWGRQDVRSGAPAAGPAGLAPLTAAWGLSRAGQTAPSGPVGPVSAELRAQAERVPVSGPEHRAPVQARTGQAGPPPVIYRQPERRESTAPPAQAPQELEGEAALRAQSVSPAQVAAWNEAFSYDAGRTARQTRDQETLLSREEEERVVQRVLKDLNYNRMADEVLDRVERRLRTERRKIGR